MNNLNHEWITLISQLDCVYSILFLNNYIVQKQRLYTPHNTTSSILRNSNNHQFFAFPAKRERTNAIPYASQHRYRPAFPTLQERKTSQYPIWRHCRRQPQADLRPDLDNHLTLPGKSSHYRPRPLINWKFILKKKWRQLLLIDRESCYLRFECFYCHYRSGVDYYYCYYYYLWMGDGGITPIVVFQ